MLDHTLKDQLRDIFAALESQYTLDITVWEEQESRTELLELLQDVASCSDSISCRVKEGNSLEFGLLKNGQPTGIHFRGIPNGHEFTSLLMAILNSEIGRAHV